MRSFSHPLLGSINSDPGKFKVVVSSPDHEEKKDEPSVYFLNHILHLIMDYCDLSSGFGVSAFSQNKQENITKL